MRTFSKYGKLGFPNFTKFNVAHYTQKQTGEAYNDKTKQKEPVFSTVMHDGTFNIVANPAEPINVGEEIEHPFYKNLSFTVQEILEQRKAMGDWSCHDIEPIMQVCRVTLN